MENSVHYESGSKNEIAVVLSCPGREEEQANPPSPAQGQTGRNLNYVLDILSNTYKLQGFSRAEIIITNAWDQVEYPEKTQRSEATAIEILQPSNLDRLATEIGGVSDYILACGQNASISVMALKYAGKLSNGVQVAFVEHLGNQALNSCISTDVDGNIIKSYKNASERPADDTRSLDTIKTDNKNKRLAVVAKKIYEQIKTNNHQ